MPRQPTYDLPGYPQHVIQRGNNRWPVFFDVSDYGRYLEGLHQVAEKTRGLVKACVLTTDHVNARRVTLPCQRQRV